MSSRLARIGACLLGLVLVTGVGADAHASHYYLADVDFLDDAERAALETLGMATTEDLLAALRDASSRATLRGQIGADNDRIDELTRTCDLLQVIGIGPRAARLVRSAGVTGAADLAGRDAAELLVLLEAANAEHRHTEVNPTIDHVRDWIASARERSVEVTW